MLGGPRRKPYAWLLDRVITQTKRYGSSSACRRDKCVNLFKCWVLWSSWSSFLSEIRTSTWDPNTVFDSKKTVEKYTYQMQSANGSWTLPRRNFGHHNRRTFCWLEVFKSFVRRQNSCKRCRLLMLHDYLLNWFRVSYQDTSFLKNGISGPDYRPDS